MTRRAEQLATGSKPAPGELALVQGYVNTVDLESGRDAFGTPEGVASWLRFHGLAEDVDRLGEEDRQRAVGVREALRDLLSRDDVSAADEDPVGRLRSLTEPVLYRMDYDPDGTVRIVPAAGGLDGALGRLQVVIHRAMLEGTWARLKICQSDTCRWAFYDASRNRSGAWCSMQVCGNRTKVREHRRRKTDPG